MTWRLDNRRRWILLGLAVAALLLQALLDATRAPIRQRDYALKLEAATLAAAAFDSLRATRISGEAELDLVNDPAGTGLIGPETSLITNATGDLDSKLTSLNPNFAAVLVQYFRQIGLKRGDSVAVAVSGSFPGLNICLYAALEVMHLRPVIVTSIGSSNWGANDPDFTWLDMETLLQRAGLFQIRSLAASCGGGDDMGRGLSPRGRRLLEEAAERNGIPMLRSDNIEQAISQRMSFYQEKLPGHGYRLFVNIGGGVASLGSSLNKPLLSNGLLTELPGHNWPRKGCLILMAEKGVPIVHLLGITELARRHGLPVAPDWRPEPGEGEIFVKTTYRLPLAAGILVLYCGICVLILAPELHRGLFDRWNRRMA